MSPGYVIAALPSAPYPGWYLKSVGSVDAYWTPALAEAMRFASFAAALGYWDSVPPGRGHGANSSVSLPELLTGLMNIYCPGRLRYRFRRLQA